jgi:hypothetical protein
MTTTLQQIVDRAVARSVANRGTSLVPTDTALTVERIGTAEHALFVRLASDQRTYFQRRAAVTTTASVAGAARTADLAAVTPPVVRVLRVARTLDGREVLPVDLQREDDAWGPRYTTAGLTLTEVVDATGATWSPSDPAALALTVDYVAGPVALNLAGALTQTVTVPDLFVDLLVNRFAAFLVLRDVGRDEQELAALDAEYERRYSDFLKFMDTVAGRFPAAPAAPERKA